MGGMLTARERTFDLRYTINLSLATSLPKWPAPASCHGRVLYQRKLFLSQSLIRFLGVAV
jgi:hypothetical protein